MFAPLPHLRSFRTLIKAIKDAQAAASYMDWKAGLITDKEYEKAKGSVMEIRQKEREKER